MSNIQDYLDGLVPALERAKAASPDLSHLSLSDLEELMGIKSAEEIMYTGGVGNGDPKHPGWPRAALGVDGANRPATPEEKREQNKVVMPDVAHTTPKRTGESFVKKAVLAVKLANMATTAARGLAHAPPIPAAARAVRPAGGMFAPAPGPSPFMGLGAAPKLAPARPLPANSMQTPQFLARQPGGAGMLEAVGAVNEISRMPGKAQSLALGKRMGIGSDVAAHRAHLANTQGMTHLASLDLSRFFAKLAGTLDPAVTARARAYMSQIAQRHAIVRDAIPDMAATGARLRAAAAAKEQMHAPVVAAVKSFPRPAGVTPPSIPSAPVSPYGTTVPNTRLGTTVPNSTAPIPGSGRQRPAWAAPPSMGEAPAASVAKTMVARPR